MARKTSPRIISASRRTDIPAFYAAWFINRVRAGYCTVPNPFNPNQVSWVSLKPEDVDVIVFWTRNPVPLMPYLHELDERGLRYYFQYTLMNNPRSLDAKAPLLHASLETFKRLAEQIGPERVIWRYDPIVFTPQTDAYFHLTTFATIAKALRGSTTRAVISIMDPYPKAQGRLNYLARQGMPVWLPDSNAPEFMLLMSGLAEIAAQNDLDLVSCAEDLDLSRYGIRPGKCIDDDYIQKVFGIEVTHQKDPYQRRACGCVESKDIGVYNTCLFGCQYCYATQSFAQAVRNYKEKHHPESPSMIGWYDARSPEGTH